MVDHETIEWHEKRKDSLGLLGNLDRDATREFWSVIRNLSFLALKKE